MIMIIMIMSVFLERLSMCNMLNCAEHVQIQTYQTHAYKTPTTAGVEIITLKHPTKHKKNTHKTQIPYQRTHVALSFKDPRT